MEFRARASLQLSSSSPATQVAGCFSGLIHGSYCQESKLNKVSQSITSMKGRDYKFSCSLSLPSLLWGLSLVDLHPRHSLLQGLASFRHPALFLHFAGYCVHHCIAFTSFHFQNILLMQLGVGKDSDMNARTLLLSAKEIVEAEDEKAVRCAQCVNWEPRSPSLRQRWPVLTLVISVWLTCILATVMVLVPPGPCGHSKQHVPKGRESFYFSFSLH